MKSDPSIERWHAIYHRLSPSVFDLVALLRRAEDAEVWHAAPDCYVNAIRRVRIRPAPIEILEPGPGDYETAIDLLDAIANGPDSRIGDTLERISEFLKRVRP